jgi:glutaredoxin-like protein NrdH
MTKKWLDDPKRGNLKGQYEVVDLSTNPEALAAVKALGYESAPVVVMNIDGNTKNEMHWFGFRPDNLEEFAPLALTLVAAY